MSPLVLTDRKTNTQTVQPEITLFPQASTPKSAKDSYLDYEEGSKIVRAITLDDQKGRFEHKNPFRRSNNKKEIEMIEKQDVDISNILENVEINPGSPVIEIKEELGKEEDGPKTQNADNKNLNETVSENKNVTLQQDLKEKEDCETNKDLENPESEVKEVCGQEQDDIPAQSDNNQDLNAVTIENKDKGFLKRLRKPQKPKVIDITFFEYLKSFVSKSEPLKMKMAILNEGFSTLESRLDIFNLLKKLRDIDKVKGLIFDKDQLFLFDRLSRPDIMKQADHWFQEEYLTYYEIYKDANGIEELKQKGQLIETQKRIQDKSPQTDLDQKILSLS